MSSEFISKFFEDGSPQYNAIILEYNAYLSSPQGRRMNVESWMFNSERFKFYLTEMFQRTSGEFLGKCAIMAPPGSLRKFITKVHQAGMFNREILYGFFLEQPYILDSLSRKISDAHRFYRKDVCAEEEMSTYLEEVRESVMREIVLGTVDVEKCVTGVVRAKSESLMLDTSEQAQFVGAYREDTGEDPMSEVLGDFQDFISNRSRLMEVYMQYRRGTYDFKFEEMTTRFMNLFDREITVYELRILQREVLRGESVSEILERYAKCFREKQGILEQLWQKYLNRQPLLYEFVKPFCECVTRLDGTEFEQVVVQYIVKGGEYVDVITGAVEKFFEDCMHPGAVEKEQVMYFVGRLRDRSLSASDQESVQLMHEMYEEWTNQQKEIGCLFERVLGRLCERAEINKFVEYYRLEGDSKLRPEFVIEEELYASLEYQDVVKEKLLRLVPSMPRATLYHLISRGIESDLIKTLRSDEAILEFSKA